MLLLLPTCSSAHHFKLLHLCACVLLGLYRTGQQRQQLHRSNLRQMVLRQPLLLPLPILGQLEMMPRARPARARKSKKGARKLRPLQQQKRRRQGEGTRYGPAETD